jgi:hypothetical protein
MKEVVLNHCEESFPSAWRESMVQGKEGRNKTHSQFNMRDGTAASQLEEIE